MDACVVVRKSMYIVIISTSGVLRPCSPKFLGVDTKPWKANRNWSPLSFEVPLNIAFLFCMAGGMPELHSSASCWRQPSLYLWNQRLHSYLHQSDGMSSGFHPTSSSLCSEPADQKAERAVVESTLFASRWVGWCIKGWFGEWQARGEFTRDLLLRSSPTLWERAQLRAAQFLPRASFLWTVGISKTSATLSSLVGINWFSYQM